MGGDFPLQSLSELDLSVRASGKLLIKSAKGPCFFLPTLCTCSPKLCNESEKRLPFTVIDEKEMVSQYSIVLRGNGSGSGATKLNWRKKVRKNQKERAPVKCFLIVFTLLTGAPLDKCQIPALGASASTNFLPRRELQSQAHGRSCGIGTPHRSGWVIPFSP